MTLTMEIKIYLEMAARFILHFEITAVSMTPMNFSLKKCVVHAVEVSGKVKIQLIFVQINNSIKRVIAVRLVYELRHT